MGNDTYLLILASILALGAFVWICKMSIQQDFRDQRNGGVDGKVVSKGHPDDDASVDAFADELKDELYFMRCSDPDECYVDQTIEELELRLRFAMRGGHLVGIAICCMMLHSRGVTVLSNANLKKKE